MYVQICMYLLSFCRFNPDCCTLHLRRFLVCISLSASQTFNHPAQAVFWRLLGCTGSRRARDERLSSRKEDIESLLMCDARPFDSRTSPIAVMRQRNTHRTELRIQTTAPPQ
jgi:hypothetical protein